MGVVELSPRNIFLGGIGSLIGGILIAAGGDIYNYGIKPYIISIGWNPQFIVSTALIGLGLVATFYGGYRIWKQRKPSPKGGIAIAEIVKSTYVELLPRKQLSPFDDYLSSAKAELHIIAVNAGGLVHQVDTFKALLKNNVSITVLVVKKNPLMFELNERTFGTLGVEKIWKGALTVMHGIKIDKELGEKDRKRLSIMTHDLLPLESMVIIDPESEDGKMHVETYAYGKDTQSRPNLILSKRDQKDLFNIYWSSYVYALSKAEPYNPADLS